jgi:hypothetical protein
MRLRFLPAAAAVLALAIPAAAQAPKADGPAVTVQTAPLGKLLEDVKSIVRTVAGDGPVKQMEESIKEGLGEKGFTGLDLLRPPAGYVDLEKVKDLEDPKDLSGFLLVPVTDEKEFVEFLKRINLEVEPVAGKDGLYRLDPKDEPAEFPVRMRFAADRYAHIGFNVRDDAMAADKLVQAAKLIDPAERGLLAYTVHISRLPKALTEQSDKQVEQATDQLKDLPLPPGAADALGDVFKSFSRINEQMYSQGEVAVLRLFYDQASAEVGYEMGLKARPGTALAKEIAARKPTTNRFAGLAGGDTAAGILAQLPTFTKELQDAIASGLDAGRKMAAQEAPEEYRAVIDEALAGLGRTVKSGEFDLAAVVNGPDAGGKFTVVVGVSFDDPSKLETELRALHKNAPEEIRNMIRLDDAKAGDVSIHRMAVGLFLPPEVQAVFGDKASICLAFAPKGIYLSFGPAAVDTIKSAVAAKPAESKALDVLVNPSRVQKLAAAIDPQAGQGVAQAIGTADERVSALSLTVEGGGELRFRLAVALKLIPRAIGFFADVSESAPGAAAPVPAARVAKD